MVGLAGTGAGFATPLHGRDDGLHPRTPRDRTCSGGAVSARATWPPVLVTADAATLFRPRGQPDPDVTVSSHSATATSLLGGTPGWDEPPRKQPRGRSTPWPRAASYAGGAEPRGEGRRRLWTEGGAERPGGSPPARGWAGEGVEFSALPRSPRAPVPPLRCARRISPPPAPGIEEACEARSTAPGGTRMLDGKGTVEVNIAGHPPETSARPMCAEARIEVATSSRPSERRTTGSVVDQRHGNHREWGGGEITDSARGRRQPGRPMTLRVEEAPSGGCSPNPFAGSRKNGRRAPHAEPPLEGRRGGSRWLEVHPRPLSLSAVSSRGSPRWAWAPREH